MGALLGALFYIWSKPTTGRKGQSKLSWEDAAAIFLALMLLGVFR